MRLHFLFSCAVFISSSLLGPQPNPLEPMVPASHRNDGPPQATSLGDQKWQNLLTDPTMQDIIERALKNNPDPVAATYRIEEAQAISGAAHARLPQSGFQPDAIKTLIITDKEKEIRALLVEFPAAVARVGSLSQLAENLTIAGGQPSSLLERRADVAAAAQSFRAATAETGAAKALITFEKASQQAFLEAADALNTHRKTGEIIPECSLFTAELDLADSRPNRLKAVG